ncbi:MAG: RlmE family RNA methyltransferase [Anaerolineales bacterium]|nr:RlmE family RNA methyltransferase [Anaerolineales bacterium]
MSKGQHWRKNQKKDRYFQQAKADGYRARSAYKLQGIQQKFRLLRPADRVLDVGAAPGSWSQVAVEQVGVEGLVVAVDLTAIAPLPGVVAVQGDIRDAAVQANVRALAGDAPFDVVISDIAPKTTGVQLTDHARSIELSLFALAVAVRWLRVGGHFVTKIFEGEDLPHFVELAERHFHRVYRFDPDATRRESKETFLIGKGLRANAEWEAARGVAWLLLHDGAAP